MKPETFVKLMLITIWIITVAGLAAIILSSVYGEGC